MWLDEAEADFCLFLCWLWPYVISYIVSSTMKFLKQLDVATIERNIHSKSRVGSSSSLAKSLPYHFSKHLVLPRFLPMLNYLLSQ